MARFVWGATLGVILPLGCRTASTAGPGDAEHPKNAPAAVASTDAWTPFPNPYGNSAPNPAQDVKGTVVSTVVSDADAAARRARPSTTSVVTLSGLKPGMHYMAHVHLLACSDGKGGSHYQNVPGGPADPTNEIWFDLQADPSGAATAKARVPWAVRPGGAKSVVLHDMTPDPAGKLPKLACQNVAF